MDSECLGELKCGRDNCYDYRDSTGWPNSAPGWDKTDDCCYCPKGLGECNKLDECGVMNGDGSSCADDCGVPYGNGTSCLDQCGIPNGNGESCLDECGVINGNNTCLPPCTDYCTTGIPGGPENTKVHCCGVINGNNTCLPPCTD